MTSTAPSVCSSASAPAPGVVSPAGAASATGSTGQHERTWESPRPERHRRRLSGGERSRSGKKRGKGRSPSPTRSSRLARASASSSSASSDAGEKASAMPPPPAGRPGVGCGRSEGGCVAPGRDCSPQPGPSELGSGLRSLPGAGRSRSDYGGCSSLALSGAAEDDSFSTSDSVDLDRDDSFKSVLRLIRDFQFQGTGKCSPEPMQDFSCTGLWATIRVFPSSSLASFPLTVVSPSRQHRRYCRTSSSSFPGPYTVLPGLASITLEKVSESRKRSVSLSLSQVSSLETMLECVRGHLLAGLVAVHLKEFPGASNRRKAWQLRAVDARWFESLGVPRC